jgi:two-component system nitrogen regulation sensor histidine kinase NtrY
MRDARIFKPISSLALFASLFGLTGLVVAACLAVAVSGAGPLTTGSPVVLTALLINCALIVGLAGIITLRIVKLYRRRQQGDAAARLHIKYAALFCLAGATPAVIIALFFGVAVSTGLEGWFGSRVRVVVENAVNVAQSYVRQETDSLKSEVLALAVDLDRVAPTLKSDPRAYQKFLENQAAYRNLPAVYVIAPDGTVLAKAEGPTAPAFTAPRAQTLARANDGDVIMATDDANNVLRAVYALKAYDGARVYVIRFVDAGILTHLRQAEQAVVGYRDAEAGRQKLQVIFMLAYVEIALLVLVGTAWLGLASATRITGPMGGLVAAAARLSQGDFTPFEPDANTPSELRPLSSAFFQMTSDLEAQRTALIAERARAERRRQFIEAVLSGVSAGVISLDQNTVITAINQPALDHLGLGQDQAVGQGLTTVVPEFQAVLDAPRRVADITLDRAGDVRQLQARLSGEGAARVLTFDDVTQLVSAQRNAAWRDVARRIAHEIKNPLTPIQLSVERLQKKYKDEIKTEPEIFNRCTDIILRQVIDIGRMVDEFSTFARMPAPELAQAKVGDLVREAAFAQSIASPAIAVHTHLPKGPLYANCDARLITQALANILKNAAEAVMARHHADADAPMVLDIQLTAAEDFAVITVTDTGIGLPAKDRHRLTEPYVTTREKGTGLGLAIVKRVVEEHGGDLVLTDNPDAQGARVIVRLPLCPAPHTLKTVEEERV